MDRLMAAVAARLADDTTLQGLVDTVGGVPAILQFRNFENPAELHGRLPHVVFRLDGDGDSLGLHGAAVDVGCEVKVWGYGPSVIPAVLQAAQRVDELLLRRMEPSPGGGTVRWRSVTGWQPVDDTDALTVHYSNSYVTRYWSDGRIAALTS